MTNNEWLIKENKLVEFLGDIMDGRFEKVCKDYNIITTDPTPWSLLLSKWLQEEHKEYDKYVKLSDVNKVIHDIFKDVGESLTNCHCLTCECYIRNDINKLSVVKLPRS